MKRHIIALVLACSLGSCLRVAASPPPARFDFTLPWDDFSSTAIDLSYLNHKPAGLFGQVTAGPDGHLYVRDERMRFLAVNVTAADLFP
jgi:hypothetical protein